MSRHPRALHRVIGAVLCVWLGLEASPRLQQTFGKTILTTIVDSRGRSIVDLGLDDFVVTEGGQPRVVVDLHVADYPIVLLIDGSIEANAWPPIRAAARRFIDSVGERPVAVGTLALGPVSQLDDTRAAVLEKLEQLTPSAGDAAGALTATARAAALLSGTGAPFSSIVIIAARAIDSRQLVQSDLLTAILASNATVHVIEGRAAPSAEPVERIPDLLESLTAQTRGQYVSVFASASFGNALERLADRLAAEMMVQFITPFERGGGEVSVGVRRPGARALGLGVR